MTLIIRPRRAGDMPALRTLFESVFGAWPGDAFWHWKYEGYAKALACVAEDQVRGQLVGHAAAILFPGGRGQLAQVMDVMVHPDYRSAAHAESALYPALMRRLTGELAIRDPEIFAFGFAGLRPFRLGARLGLYRALHACYAVAQAHDRVGRGWERLPWQEAHLSDFEEAAGTGTGGPTRTQGFLQWRYAQHPLRDYALWRTPRGMAITTAPWRTRGPAWLMESAGEWTGAMPGLSLLGWQRGPFLDKGFGPMNPEPDMIASQVLLQGQGAHPLPPNLQLQPGDTDVL